MQMSANSGWFFLSYSCMILKNTKTLLRYEIEVSYNMHEINKLKFYY